MRICFVFFAYFSCLGFYVVGYRSSLCMYISMYYDGAGKLKTQV